MKLSALILLLTALEAACANYYVRTGASGSRSGADWTDANTNLPSALTRGDTYYIADTDINPLPAYTFDDAVTGTTLITIKKATVADHGTSTGWADSYGNGVAEWTGSGAYGWYFPNAGCGYYYFAGLKSTSTAPSTNVQGFRLNMSASGDGINGAYSNINHGITFEGVEVYYPSNSGPPYATAFYWPTFASNTTVRYCYFTRTPGDMAQTRGLKDFAFEYNYIGANFQDATRHGDGIENDEASTNYVIRFNWWEDQVGTYTLGHHNAGVLDGLKIYGNVFYWTTSFAGSMDNGLISSLTSGSGYITNMFVVHNTFANLLNGQTGGAVGNVSINPRNSGCVVTNNFFHFKIGDTATTTFTYGSSVAQGYNANWNRTVAGDNAQNDSGSPFVDFSTRNVSLVSATTAGATVASEFNTDMNGNLLNGTRGALSITASTTYRGFSFGSGVKLIGAGSVRQ